MNIYYWRKIGNIEGYAVGIVECIYVYIRKIGGNKGSGTVLSGGLFEGNSYGNLGGTDPGLGDPLGILNVTEGGARKYHGGKVMGTTLRDV